MQNAQAHKIQWSGSTVHFFTVAVMSLISGYGDLQWVDKKISAHQRWLPCFIMATNKEKLTKVLFLY